MIALRPYQERDLPRLRAAYEAGKRRLLYVAPTGSGKTSLTAMIIALARKRRRVLFLTHRRELMDQTVATLARAGVDDVLTIRAQHQTGSPGAPVVVASVQTVAGESWISRLPDAGFVVVDEAHRAAARTWAALLERYATADVLGLTATPIRSDDRPLGDVFDALVVGPSVRELTDLGFLVRCWTWSAPEQLEAGWIATSPLEAYRAHAGRARAVVFCVDRKHAAAVAVELTAGDVPAEVVDGTLSDRDRSARLLRFRCGETRAVTTVHALTEGWDDPGCSVCILARRLGHVGAYLQAAGRVLRPAPGKTEARLLDLCGSALEHGTPDVDRAYSLDGRGISSPDRLAISQCPACGGVFETGPRACPYCGVTAPVRSRPAPRIVGAELVDVSTPAQMKATTLRVNLRNAARASGRSQAWVEAAERAIVGGR